MDLHLDDDQQPHDPSVIVKDGCDEFVYRGSLGALPDLGKLEQEGESKNSAWPSLLSDLHASLYKATPRAREEDAEGVPEAHRRLMEQVMESLDYDRLRATTKLSRAGAAIGTLELGEDLLEKIPAGEPKLDPQDPNDEGWEYLKGCEGPDDQGRLMRRLVRSANRKAQETMETMRGLGWGSDPTVENGLSNLQEAARVSRRLKRDSSLRKIAALAGRMRRLALAKRKTRARRKPDEVVGVELGGDLHLALPSELAKLRTPLRRDVLLRWSQRQLLQYEVEGTEQKSQGPIVVCIDSSGSMKGDRDTWAKAVALGLLAIAQREKRSFAVIHFGANRSNLRTFRFGREVKMAEVVECLSLFLNASGTDFESPLDEAMNLIEDAADENELKKADVIFLTDGEATVGEAFKESFRGRAQRSGAHLYTVYIGRAGWSLNDLSDGVACLPRTDEGQDVEALELCFGI